MATLYSMFAPAIVSDVLENGVRHMVVRPSSMVCSTQIDIDIEGDTVKNVKYTRGCSGNTQGVAALVQGMKVDEACRRLSGINCNGKGTSCPDQLAMALKYALETAVIEG